MPVRNCQETIVAAVRSIISQTYQNWELLLIDDGSMDLTLEAASDFHDKRIKMISDGIHGGLISRLNQALQLSGGKYFARMDGDDIAYPRRIEQQVNYLQQHSNIDLVGTWMIVFGKDGNPIGKRAAPERHAMICARPYSGFPIAHPTYMGRLKWFRQYHYRRSAIRCEDQDLLFRSYRSSRFANVPEILLGYREERIDLKKILRGRFSFARILAAEFLKQKQPIHALRALMDQTSKGILDCIAVNLGLNYRLLRHRAQPITESERSEWEGVWRLVNGAS